MWDRLVIWCEIHDTNRHLYAAWCVGFASLMLLWPVLFYALGVNVFDSAWYWLSYFL